MASDNSEDFKIDRTPKWPPWTKPGFERPDKRQFKRGELVRVKDQYFYVLEDNRSKAHCTYTYTLLPVNAKEEIDQSGDLCTRVFCEYPRDIEPCNNTEIVLYHNEVLWQKYFNRFIRVIKPLEYITVDIRIDDINGKNETKGST